MRRKRFQKGSLQARKHGRHRVWVAFWWEDGSRRCKVLGRCSQMTKAEAEAALSALLRAINSGATQTAQPVYTFEQFIRRRVPAVLPSQLEGIDCGHFGADHQVASRFRSSARVCFIRSVARTLQDFLDRKARGTVRTA